MNFLEHKPLSVRKNIALGITAGTMVLLLVVLGLIYSHPKKESSSHNGSLTKVGQFYATILENAKSYFGNKDAIIDK